MGLTLSLNLPLFIEGYKVNGWGWFCCYCSGLLIADIKLFLGFIISKWPKLVKSTALSFAKLF